MPAYLVDSDGDRVRRSARLCATAWVGRRARTRPIGHRKIDERMAVARLGARSRRVGGRSRSYRLRWGSRRRACAGESTWLARSLRRNTRSGSGEGGRKGGGGTTQRRSTSGFGSYYSNLELDATVLGSAVLGLVARDRLRLAEAAGAEAALRDPFFTKKAFTAAARRIDSLGCSRRCPSRRCDPRRRSSDSVVLENGSAASLRMGDASAGCSLCRSRSSRRAARFLLTTGVGRRWRRRRRCRHDGAPIPEAMAEKAPTGCAADDARRDASALSSLSLPMSKAPVLLLAAPVAMPPPTAPATPPPSAPLPHGFCMHVQPAAKVTRSTHATVKRNSDSHRATSCVGCFGLALERAPRIREERFESQAKRAPTKSRRGCQFFSCLCNRTRVSRLVSHLRKLSRNKIVSMKSTQCSPPSPSSYEGAAPRADVPCAQNPGRCAQA